ncbi:MAG: hypothetical protein L3J28_05650 [Candidatus Polarisedimenticolaceae bacterium]|nr:hypothetical protein [Candidatus Polarisedimenticolaceae bacterium]
MHRNLLAILSLFALLPLFFCTASSAQDFPHSIANGVICFDCHDLHGGADKLLKVIDPSPAEDMHDTPANNLCWSCHNDVIAPFMKTHSSIVIDNGYGDWAMECRTCHDPHFHQQPRQHGADAYLFQGLVSAVTSNTLTSTGAGWTEDQFAGLILFPDLSNSNLSHRILSNSSDTLTVATPIDLSQVVPGDSFSVIYGKLIRTEIKAPDRENCSVVDNIFTCTNTFPRPVKFFKATGSNSFADSDEISDGPCQVCHSRTTHFRFDGTGSDQWHMNVGGTAGQKCTEVCHMHKDGFAHGGGGMGNGDATVCVRCHGHEPNTRYDPDAQYPYTDPGEGGAVSRGAGTSTPHSTHTESWLTTYPPENGEDDKRGPAIYCSVCHAVNKMPTFKSGTDIDGDGLIRLEETDVCDACHSPEGSYNGVNSVNNSVGAKDNWNKQGVYNTDGSLREGKERWCAGCHDESPAVIANQANVMAPNIVGDEDASTNYGTGWGFYKTGHGRPSGSYPASGAPAARKNCPDCHNTQSRHIDGEHRSYSADGDYMTYSPESSSYQNGYRLKDVPTGYDGQYPMHIPRQGHVFPPGFRQDWEFALCFSCHDRNKLLDGMDTNFRSATINAHSLHTDGRNGPWGPTTAQYDSDFDGVADSRITCTACHNVHGSPSPRMLRHGELMGPPLINNKVPALDFQYQPTNTYPTLIESTGGKLRFIGGGAGNVAKNGVCNMCHNDGINYLRTPIDIYPPKILAVLGSVGSNQLAISFSKGVYSTPSLSGSLQVSDFIFTDNDNSRFISNISHLAGNDSAALTLSSALDSSNDIDIDTLNTALSSIFDYSGNAMSTLMPVTVTEDAIPPTISNLFPANNAVDVRPDGELIFTLSDDAAGIDWSSFAIQLSGDLGYNKNYTDTDGSIVSKNGSPVAYEVHVQPDSIFASGELISISISVNDLAGNPMPATAWSFTAATGGLWLSPATITGTISLQSAGNLIDDNLSTANAFSPGGPNHLASFKLNNAGDPFTVSDVRIYGGAQVYSWRVYTSTDGVNFSQVSTISVGGASQWYEVAIPLSSNVTHMRVNNWHGGPEPASTIYEFQFKGIAE